MKSNERNRKLNDRGFSLVELLIAMAILSIVVVIFYRGFVISAGINNKSRLTHKATTLAQDILEGMKGESMNEIIGQFAYPTYWEDVDGTTEQFGRFDLLPLSFFGVSKASELSSGNLGTFASATDPYATAGPNNLEVQYISTEDRIAAGGDGIYYLYLNNLQMENSYFDALIKIDGTSYIDSTKTEDDVFTPRDYNGLSSRVVKIPSMDTNFDAIASYCYEYDEQAKAILVQQLEGNGAVIPAGMTVQDYVEQRMERTITINIEENILVSGKLRQMVTALYEYSCGEGATKATCQFPQTGSGDQIFNNQDNSENQLRYVYIFYQPSYHIGKDSFVINRNYDDDADKMEELQLYLIKQWPRKGTITAEDTVVFEYISDLTWEHTYRADVRINEKIKGFANAGDPKILLRTNLGYRLDAPDTEVGAGVLQANYYYNNVALTSSQAEEKLRLNTLSNMTTSDKVMDVEVTIYAHDDGVEMNLGSFGSADRQKLISLEGTIRN